MTPWTTPMTRRGLVLFGLMSVIWGIPYLFIRIAVDEISPATLVFVRTVIGAAILLPIALLRVDLRPVLRRWRWQVVCVNTACCCCSSRPTPMSGGDAVTGRSGGRGITRPARTK